MSPAACCFTASPSNTEPLLRVNAGAKNATRMARVRDEDLSITRA
ncbi:hypothetical protein [Streptomyces scabiei]